MSVSEFIEHWVGVSGCDNGGADGKSSLYLKDWHFVKVCFLKVCSFIVEIYSILEILLNFVYVALFYVVFFERSPFLLKISSSNANS